MGGGSALLVAVEQRAEVDIDIYAKIVAALADRVAQASEREVVVLLGIAEEDEPAFAAHELVDSHVFEVSAVGKVDVVAFGGCHAKKLVHKVQQPDHRAGAAPFSCVSGVA